MLRRGGLVTTATALVFLSVPAVSAAASVASAAPVALAPLPGDESSIASGVNDAGTVVGSSGTRATQWRNGNPSPLTVPDGASEASAMDINDNGVIVGHSGKYAVRWDASGAITALRAPDGDDDIVLGDINNSGTVVGFTTRNAVRFTKGGTGTILPGLPGASSTWARAISDTDIIVGTAGDSPDQPVRWDASDQLQVLDEFPGSGSQCFDVANDGTAVGFSGNHPAKWDSDGRVSEVEQLPKDQYPSTSVTGIAKNGAYAVGLAYSPSYSPRGVVWQLK